MKITLTYVYKMYNQLSIPAESLQIPCNVNQCVIFDLNEKNVANALLGRETKHITDLLSTLNLKF